MSEDTDDRGLLLALTERFEKQRLPRLLDIQKRVTAGEVLSDPDIAFLDSAFEDAQHVTPLVERHPEYRELVSKVAGLYREITERALANEKNRT